MKFLIISLALMACSTLALPQAGEMTAPGMEGEMPEGEMEEEEWDMMPSKEDMFLMKLGPIIMKMKMKKMMAMKAKVNFLVGSTVSFP